MEELSHQTVDGEFDGSSEISNCNMALWAGGGKTQGEGIAARAEKARAWARSTMGDSVEAETAAGRNGPGQAGIMRRWHSEWLGSAGSTMSRKMPWLLPFSYLTAHTIARHKTAKTTRKTEQGSLRTVVPWNAELTLRSQEEIGEETGKCHQISYS